MGMCWIHTEPPWPMFIRAPKEIVKSYCSLGPNFQVEGLSTGYPLPPFFIFFQSKHDPLLRDARLELSELEDGFPGKSLKVPLNEGCKTKKTRWFEAFAQHEAVLYEHHCVQSRVLEVWQNFQKLWIWFSAFFPGSKGWSHLAYTTLGFVDPVAPDPEGGAAA